MDKSKKLCKLSLVIVVLILCVTIRYTWKKDLYNSIHFAEINFNHYGALPDHNEAKFIDENQASSKSAVNVTEVSDVIHPQHARLKKALRESLLTALDPKSPFYGLPYKKAYGLPLSDYGVLDKFQEVEEKWEDFFPDLKFAFDQYEMKNPNKDRNSTTNYISVEMHSVEDRLVAFVQSYDILKRAKSFGGDYIQARIFRVGTPVDGVPSLVVDHRNGTYSLTAPIPYEGELTLEVNLLLSVEALYEINERQKKLTAWKKGDSITNLTTGEVTYCGPDVNLKTAKKFKDVSLCDYSNPRNQEPWYCMKPRSGTCSPIKYTKENPNYFWEEDNILKSCETYTCKRCTTKKFNASISSQKRKDDQDGPPPKCSDLFNEGYSSFVVSGYLKNGTWVSSQCKSEHSFNVLQNKVIYFLGDSTIRQFYQRFYTKYKLQNLEVYPLTIKHRPRLAYSKAKSANLTFYYRAHSLPFNNAGPVETHIPISDSISGIPVGGSSVYVVFSLGPHFQRYTPSLFVHRVKGIKNAILRHHRLFPGTRFLVKGLNFVTIREVLWNNYRFDTILRTTFKNMKNVVFLNFWDLTTVWPQDGIHPKLPIFKFEGDIMLSYIV